MHPHTCTRHTEHHVCSGQSLREHEDRNHIQQVLPLNSYPPRARHFSDDETEAQRGIAVDSGSHSLSEQNEVYNLGSHGQGLGSPHDAHGHLLPTQQEYPGLNPTPKERQQTDMTQH